jgi:hypothetical protein
VFVRRIPEETGAVEQVAPDFLAGFLAGFLVGFL